MLTPADFARMTGASLDPYTVTDAVLAGYASNYFEYDGQRQVREEAMAGGRQVYRYRYFTGATEEDHNLWARKTVETRPDGAQKTVYTNFLGNVILERLVSGSQTWLRYYQYDSDGREILEATPAAVSGFVEWQDGALDVSLKPSDGLIRLTEYYASGSGQPAGYLARRLIQQGSGGTAIPLSE